MKHKKEKNNKKKKRKRIRFGQWAFYLDDETFEYIWW